MLPFGRMKFYESSGSFYFMQLTNVLWSTSLPLLHLQFLPYSPSHVSIPTSGLSVQTAECTQRCLPVRGCRTSHCTVGALDYYLLMSQHKLTIPPSSSYSSLGAYPPLFSTAVTIHLSAERRKTATSLHQRLLSQSTLRNCPS